MGYDGRLSLVKGASHLSLIGWLVSSDLYWPDQRINDISVIRDKSARRPRIKTITSADIFDLIYVFFQSWHYSLLRNSILYTNCSLGKLGLIFRSKMINVSQIMSIMVWQYLDSLLSAYAKRMNYSNEKISKLDWGLIRSSLRDGLSNRYPHWWHEFGPSSTKFVYPGHL